MQLDMFTVLVATVAVAFVLALVFLYFWASDRRAPWLAWLCAAYLMAASAAVMNIWRNVLPDFLIIGVGSALLLMAFGTGWQACRVFDKRRPLLLPQVAVLTGWLLLCTSPYFMHDVGLRIATASIPAAAFLFLGSYELWRGRGEALPSRRPAVLAFAGFGLSYAVRLPMAGFAPFPLGGLPPAAWALGLTSVMGFSFAAFIAVLMVSMTKERQEALQRDYAQSDPLTGLLNRRGFIDLAGRVIGRQEYSESPFSLLMLDLDHFKSINDRFGHEVGDRVLVKFAAVLQEGVRPTDLAFRIGGEEFCCLLPNASPHDAKRIAERICARFQAASTDVLGASIRATVSVGIATSDYSGYDLDVLMAQADRAVYEAKASGRNRAVIAEVPPVSRIGLDLPRLGNSAHGRTA
jgi:diguanylate cyclase (GGDEF)-like protein